MPILKTLKKINTQEVKVEYVPEKEVILSQDKYKVGNFVSIYQLILNTPRKWITGYGCEGPEKILHDSIILVFLHQEYSML